MVYTPSEIMRDPIIISNCKLQKGGKIIRKVGEWDIVNDTLVSF